MEAYPAITTSQARRPATRLGAEEPAAIKPLGRRPYRARGGGRRRMRPVQPPNAMSEMSQKGDRGAQRAVAWSLSGGCATGLLIGLGTGRRRGFYKRHWRHFVRVRPDC